MSKISPSKPFSMLFQHRIEVKIARWEGIGVHGVIGWITGGGTTFFGVLTNSSEIGSIERKC